MYIESLYRFNQEDRRWMEESLTAASVAALTIHDMCKAVQKDMVIGLVRLLAKAGGKSGDLTGGQPRLKVLFCRCASW